MQNKNGLKDSFLKKVITWAKNFNEILLTLDFHLNRTAGGLIDNKSGNGRHSWHCLVLPSLLAGIVVMGVPEIGLRLCLSLIAIIIVFILTTFFTRLSRKGVLFDLVFQVALVIVVSGLVYINSQDTYKDRDLVYNHFFVVSAALVGGAIVISGLLAKAIRYNIGTSNYKSCLENTDLFESSDIPPPLEWSTFFIVIIKALPQLILFPSIVALLAPPNLLNNAVVISLIITFVISIIVLYPGHIDSNADELWWLPDGFLFRGGALLVSFVIIGLAIARVSKVDYVTTIFDTAESQVLALLLGSAYVLLGWYDYWVRRLLTQELLLLIKPEPSNSAKIPCGESKENCVLQIHGSSRFIAIRSHKDQPFSQAYTMRRLFKLLADKGAKEGVATPSPNQIINRIIYYKCMAALALIVLVFPVGWHIHFGVQDPQLVVINSAPCNLQLANLLFDKDRQPAYLIAASGGGTRAALYTTAVLEGLTNKHAKNIVMGSGVSGGGAALAYFAGKQPELVALESKAWDDFFNTMRQSFIKDVLNQSIEWRIVSHQRLGKLLFESFQKHWALPNKRNTLGDVADFGLILNTAIAGQFKCDPQSADCLSKHPLSEAEHLFRKKMTHSSLAGGRLIFTNLALKKYFVPSIEKIGGPSGLPIVLRDRVIPLENAAALNANFPPVFSNAAVDVDDQSRYWVTDGGAADNRGIEMLLYALRDALEIAIESKDFPKGGLPKVMVVVVDASAFSDAFRQDRGISTLTGAATQYASLLVAEQLRSIQALYKQNECPESFFQFVYLPMPLCLRERGSFGTHWMLQPNIKVGSKSGDSRTLSGDDMIKLLRVLHGQSIELSGDAQTVLNWAREDEAWSSGARELGLSP
jgi:hypothetical protein